MWLEELAVDPWARGFSWSAEATPARVADFSVVVIGAGMGGLNAAVHLKRAGIPFTVLEKNSSVGGTWYENRYPGARVDSPSRIYTHIYGAQFHLSRTRSARRPRTRNTSTGSLTPSTCEPTSSSTPRSRSIVWDDGGQAVGDHGRSTRRPADLAGQRGDQRGRVPLPAQHSDVRGHRRLPRAVVSHGALAGRARSHRQACRRGRHRMYGLPADPRDGQRSRARVRVPADAELGLSRRRAISLAYPDQVNWLDRNFPVPDKLRPVPGLVSQPAAKHLEGSPSRPGLPRRACRRAPINKQVRDLRMAFLRVKARPPSRPAGQDDAEGAADVGSAGPCRPRLQHPGRAAPRRRHAW